MSGSRLLWKGSPESGLEITQNHLQSDSSEDTVSFPHLKLIFTPFQVHDDPRLGRHFRATRDIRQGELILREKPLVMGPKVNSVPVCLGCHTQIQVPIGVRNFYKCSKCKWPLCGPGCESAERHLQECDLMAERRFIAKIDFDSSNPNKKEGAYCTILPLRCVLLKTDNPKG